MVVAVCAAVAIGFAVIAVEYHRFSADVSASGAELPTRVQAALPPSPGTLDHAQTTLVRGVGPLASGGGLLFRTDPSEATTAYLAIPPSATLVGVPVARQPMTALIDQLRRDAGIPVAHVAVIQLSNVAPLVDAMGGIDVRNPRPFQTVVSSESWRVPPGLVHLDGRHALAYLTQGRPHSTRRNTAEERVLAAVIGKAVGPSSVTELQRTAAAIAATAATDLTDADILGLVWARLKARHLVQCTAPEHQPLESTGAQKVIRAFLAPAANRPASGCQTKNTRPFGFLPPQVVVALVQHFGAWAFALIAVIATAVLAVIWAILLRRGIRFRKAAGAKDGRTRTHSGRRQHRRRHGTRSRRSSPDAPRLRRDRPRSRDHTLEAPAAESQPPATPTNRILSPIARVPTRIAPFFAGAISARDKLAGVALTRRRQTPTPTHSATQSRRHRRRFRLRVGRFLHRHPDAIWLVACVALSVALAMLIASV
jgi:hypothetical protein